MGKEENTLESRKFKDCTVCFIWINMKKKDVSYLRKEVCTKLQSEKNLGLDTTHRRKV